MDECNRTGRAGAQTRRRPALLLGASLLVLSALGAANPARKPEPHFARIAGRVARFLPREHLSRLPFDETLSARAWTNYVSSLDPGRIYFLQSDLDRFHVHKKALSETLRQGDTQFAYDVFDTFVARVQDRRDHVALLLEQGFDYDRPETYDWRRRDAPWPRDREEWNDVWRRRVKHEHLRRVLAQEWSAKQRADDAAKSDEANEETDLNEIEESDFSLSPQEFVLRPYQRHLDMLRDSDSEWVLEKYLTAFARAFDPHSEYMSPSSVEDFEIQMKLSLVGIGALLRSEDGAAQVVRVLPGGPADRDTRDIRLKPGDKIIAVGQGDRPPVDVLHWPLNRTIRLIRGKKGTRVTLVCIAASDPTGSTIKTVDLVRDEIQLEEQAAKLTMTDACGFDGEPRKIGVIHLPAFYADMASRSLKNPNPRSSANDVQALIEEAMTNRLDGLILDLRNNGGGALPEAVRIAGLFTGRGPIVQVGGLEGVNIIESRETERPVYDGPLMVLVTRVSASASEIVAGALQDYGRAIVVGDSKTHGKGTVQTVARLGLDPRLGRLKITSWIYYRVTGKSTQLKGVASDIVLPSAFEHMEMGEEYLSNPVAWSAVAPADFRPMADLKPAIAELEARSALRRATNAGFQAYMNVLRHMEKTVGETVVSLRMDDRKETLRTEREFSEKQSALMKAALETPEDATARNEDIVLNEALHIMADYAAWLQKETLAMRSDSASAAARRPAEPAPRRSLPAQILDWLRN